MPRFDVCNAHENIRLTLGLVTYMIRINTSYLVIAVAIGVVLPVKSFSDVQSPADRRYQMLVSQAINDGDMRDRDELLSYFKRADDLAGLKSDLDRLLAGDISLLESVKVSIDFHEMLFRQAVKENTYQHNRVFLARILWMKAAFYKEVVKDYPLYKKAIHDGLSIAKSLGNDSRTYELYRQYEKVMSIQ